MRKTHYIQASPYISSTRKHANAQKEVNDILRFVVLRPCLNEIHPSESFLLLDWHPGLHLLPVWCSSHMITGNISIHILFFSIHSELSMRANVLQMYPLVQGFTTLWFRLFVVFCNDLNLLQREVLLMRGEDYIYILIVGQNLSALLLKISLQISVLWTSRFLQCRLKVV